MPRTKPQQRIYYLPPGSMTVEAATLATVEQLNETGEGPYIINRGKHSIESLTKASKQDIKCYLAYLNASSQSVA